ncbi:MAG: tol-pal system protein YbgF [Nitrospiraceae bacterium]|nr:MAG: tol-pal system protein YbgF [Nitrospiraceae bacterium]
MWNHSNTKSVWTTICAICALLSTGCMAQQSDLKQTERSLQQRIKQSNDESAQTRARQSQEILMLREQELPQLRGELERALHQAQELQGKQEDLKQRSAQLEQQTKRLEQLAGKLETESTARYNQVRESLNAQDLKNKQDRDQLRMDVNARLDDVSRQMEVMRKEIIEVVQKTNSGLARSLDARLEEQQKALADNQARTEQLSAKFAQFSQSLTAFRDSLAGLSERVSQEEQAGKASATHINEMNKEVAGYLAEVNKSVASVAQKFVTRFDEQDRRLDALSKAVDQVAQDTHARGGNKGGARQSPTKPGQRSSAPSSEIPKGGQDTSLVSLPAQAEAGRPTTAESKESVRPQQVSQNSERPDRLEYERLLGLFRDGDLDGARQGFAVFLRDYGDSDLSPNARYWLGESYYGKKDYRQAIDSYDRVELDFPRSEKVPAAILKKGYAYLAMKDTKRASLAFSQVVALHPRTPEAGKASDKLAQLKESR